MQNLSAQDDPISEGPPSPKHEGHSTLRPPFDRDGWNDISKRTFVQQPSSGPSTPVVDRRDIPSAQPDMSAKNKPFLAKERLFGLQQHRQGFAYGQDLEDYTKKYAADPMGSEMASGARVWKVYLDEVDKKNAELVEGWRESLDVLLVFAGLFSAVVTTIVVESSGNLQPNYSEVTTILIQESISLQHAIAIGTIPTVGPPTIPAFEVPRLQKWVNGLWFISLILSLMTALFAVLAKQWIRHFLSSVPGTARDRARIIQSRRDSLDVWHVETIISILPTLLHLSVFIFLSGLALFLLDLCRDIGIIAAFVIGLTFAVYGASVLLPLWFPKCPYVTPLSAIMLQGVHYILLLHHHIRTISSKGLDTGSVSPSKKHIVVKETLLQSTRERREVEKGVDLVDTRVLTWLHSLAALNGSLNTVVLQAIAGLHTRFSQRERLVSEGIVQCLPSCLRFEYRRGQCVEWNPVVDYLAFTDHATSEVSLRARLQLWHGDLKDVDMEDRFILRDSIEMCVLDSYLRVLKNEALGPSRRVKAFKSNREQRICDFLNNPTPALHPFIWERLLALVGDLADHGYVLDNFRRRLGLTVLCKFGRHDWTEPATPTYGNQIIQLDDLACPELLLAAWHAFKLPKHLRVVPKHDMRHDSKQIWCLNSRILLFNLALEFFQAEEIKMLSTQNPSKLVAVFGVVQHLADNFYRDEISFKSTGKHGWLEHFSLRSGVDKESILTKYRSVFSALLKRVVEAMQNVIADDLFLHWEAASWRARLMEMYCWIDSYLSMLKRVGIFLIPPPVRSEGLQNTLLAPWTNFYCIRASSWIVRRFDADNQEVIEAFINADGLQWLTTLISNQTLESDSMAAFVMDAILRASLRNQRVMDYATSGNNISLILRLLLSTMRHGTLDWLPSLDWVEPQIPKCWSNRLLAFTRLTQLSHRNQWANALQAIIRDTPKSYETDYWGGKEYFQLLVEVRKIVGLSPSSDPSLKLWAYIPLVDIESLSIGHIFWLVSGSPVFQDKGGYYVQVEYEAIADYLDNNLKLHAQPPLSRPVPLTKPKAPTAIDQELKDISKQLPSNPRCKHPMSWHGWLRIFNQDTLQSKDVEAERI